jgi:hypothetical protein
LSEPPVVRPISRNLLLVIATDIHFWIPFAVLIGGLLLLNRLR